MRIAFIYPITARFSKSRPKIAPLNVHIGISYISSILKNNGHSTSLFILTSDNRDAVEMALDEFAPQLVCFTSVSTTYYLVKDFARKYKNGHPDIFLLAGGCHVSLNPEEAIADSFDAICIGEGELPAVELASQMERGIVPSNIRNLWIKRGNDVEKNPSRPFIENLDDLPFPDRQMWRKLILNPATTSFVLLGRGCPFRCTYCCNEKLAHLAEGRYHRFRSPNNILEEIKDCIKEQPDIKEIYFETETIGTDMTYVKQLCSSLEQFNREREHPLSFSVNLRVTPHMDHQSLLQALYQANFKGIHIGLESGSNRVRREILNRIYSNDDIMQAVTFAKKFGLRVHLYILLGLPGETLQDFQQTIDITRICKPDSYQLGIFYPYPGTTLYRICNERNLLSKRFNTPGVHEREEPVLDLPDFPRNQVIHSYIWFEYNAFKGIKPLYRILVKVFLRMASTSPVSRRFINLLAGIPLIVYLKNKLTEPLKMNS